MNLQDSAYPFEDVMLQAFSGDFARSVGTYLVTILAAQSASGVSAGASAISVANIYDLVDSIDDAYLASSKCAFAMSKATFIAISKLNSASAFPTFPITGNARDGFELLSFPVRFCPSVSAIGTGNKSVYFGDLSRLVVRRVQSATRVQRLAERWAEYGQIGFQAHVRLSAVVGKTSGASGIKYLVHA